MTGAAGEKGGGDKKIISGEAGVAGGAAAARRGVVAELEAALAGDARARGYFEQMPPSHRREHEVYVGEGKKAETRVRRAAAAVGMIVKWGEEREAAKGASKAKAKGEAKTAKGAAKK